MVDLNWTPSFRTDPIQRQGILDLCNLLPKNTIMVEIGSFAGESSLLFAQCENIKNIYCVDVFAMEDYTTWFDTHALPNPKIIKCRGKSQEVALEFFAIGINFVYIDGDHSYEGVCTDITSWLPKIIDDGIIGGHDYGREPGVKPAVDKFFGSPDKIFCDSSWIKYL